MKPEGKKSVNIEASVLREMAIEKAHTGKDIYAIVRESWALYKARAGSGTEAPNDSGSSTGSRSENRTNEKPSALLYDSVILSASPVRQLSDKEREWLDQALKILRSGTQLAKSLKENLIGFSLGVDAMLELQRMKAETGERQTDPVPNGVDKIGDGFQERVKNARRNQERIRRSMEGTPGARKRLPKTKG